MADGTSELGRFIGAWQMVHRGLAWQVHRSFRHIQLRNCTRNIRTYNRQPIEVKGELWCEVQYDKNVAPGRLIVVSNGSNLLGMDLLRALKMSIDCQKGECFVSEVKKEMSIPTSTTEMSIPTSISEFKEAFSDGIGKIVGCSHRVKMRKFVKPV